MGNSLSAPTKAYATSLEDGPATLTWNEYCSEAWPLMKQIWPAAAAYAMEAYEFSLYSFAINEIKAAFFADSSELAWLCYAVPFFARPFGGVLTGFLSDKYGRRSMVITTSYGVLLSTVVQGLVPTGWGVWGSLTLVGMRLVQGVTYGGTASLLVYGTEMANQRTLTQGGMFMTMFSAVGSLGCTLTFAILNSSLDEGQMYSFGWRLPYLIILIPGLWVAFRSHGLEESPEFREAPEGAEVVERPQTGSLWSELKEIFLQYPLNMALIVGVCVAGPSVQYVFRTYLIDWLPEYAGVSTTFTTWLLVLNNGCLLAVLPGFAYAIDKYGASNVMTITYGGGLAATMPMFWMLLYAGHPKFFGVVLEVISAPMIAAALAASTMSLGMVATDVRNLTSGLMHNTISCVFGGLSPALLSWLSEYNSMAPAYYLFACQAVTMGAVLTSVYYHEKGHKLTYLRENPF